MRNRSGEQPDPHVDSLSWCQPRVLDAVGHDLRQGEAAALVQVAIHLRMAPTV
jgi:hypothetical protein